MTLSSVEWPYLQALIRLLLALAIGLSVGAERERRGKEIGLRTFGFAALLGGLGGLLGDSYALLSIILLAVLVVLLNVQTLHAGQGTQLTTSAALLVIGFAGVLCGQGHTLTPAAVAVMTTALLAWKEPLAGFTLGLTEVELRSAILLAILAFVLYPALPEGSLDPWQLFEPRAILVTVILIAGLGFVNYVLLKVYGARGIELTGFLGGLVNSSVTVGELAHRVHESQGQMTDVAYRGILLATAAMILRNGVLLLILAPLAFASAAPALGLMLVACAALTVGLRRSATAPAPQSAPALRLQSPFSLGSALKFGVILLIIQICGMLAQQALGQVGVYAVSFFGGLFSSASAVAAAAGLASRASISPTVAGLCAVIASLTSVLISLPLVIQSHEKRLIRRLSGGVAFIVLFGILGMLAEAIVLHTFS